MFRCDDDVVIVQLDSDDSEGLEVGSLGYVVEGGTHPVVWFPDINNRQFMWSWQLEEKRWR